MIHYTCDNCGAKLETDDRIGGSRENCPACGHECDVPLSRAQKSEHKRAERERRAEAQRLAERQQAETARLAAAREAEAKRQRLERLANTVIPCPYCGEDIRAIAKKCRHCGEWLSDDPPPSKAASPEVTQNVVVKAKEGLFLQTMNCGCGCVLILIVIVVMLSAFASC